jgi:pyruvate/2-oxoglutarate dehydrogenase complex dihydrolipoamide acyltransferase (E2) component
MQADIHETVPLKGIRGIIAKSLSSAWQAPRVAQGIDINMQAVMPLVAELRQQTGKKVTVTHILLKLLSQVLADHPGLNGIVTDKTIERWKSINLGVAVNTDAGVVAPVVEHTETRSLLNILDDLAGLANQARSGSLPASAYQGGSFTVSTLGMTGIDWFTPVLNPPQIAILGIGRVVEKPWVVDGQIQVCPMMTVTLVFDHRALDGYQAGLFLSDLARRMQEITQENLVE